MSLRLHETDTVRVSLESVFTNPDDESGIDGDAGQVKTKKLRVMIEQTTLAAILDNNPASLTLTLVTASFANTNRKYIMIGSEKCEIASGWGTTSLTLASRAVKGTTIAAHLTGAAVILAYDATGAEVSVDDNSGTDEADMIDFCLDSGGSPDGNWQASLALGAIAYDSYVDIWRRLTVDAATIAQVIQDLILVVDSTLSETPTP